MVSPKPPPPCSFFRHHTHSTAFTLVVDDFLVRYSHPSELDILVSCLSTPYELKVHRDLPRYTYLGYTLDYSPTSPSPCMTLSMPNYIPSMLSHLCPSGCGSAAVYTPPVSYTDLSLHLSPPSITTPSTPVSPAKDMDPTSSWVLALLCEGTGPIPPHSSLPTLLPSIHSHSTRPVLCPLPP
jgi:hypothetical protein